MTDPEHGSAGGVRPIDEFRVITGKAAKNYANGQRRAAYCTYHERKRNARYREAKRAELRSRPLTPEEEAAKAKELERLERLKRKTRRTARARTKARYARIKADPKLHSRYTAKQSEWARAHAEERKAYKAAWYQRKVDEAIAAGLRPPRKARRGRPSKDNEQTPETDTR
jgi:uncharacterized membrane protein YqiK